jgi:putative GTP pyrophosphokinase
MPETGIAESASIESLETEYRENAQRVSRFADEIKHQLDQLLSDHQISFSFPIQSRVKQWDSIVEKLERKELWLSRLLDLSDLVGLRMILQFKRDVDTVCDLIASNFSILEQYDTQARQREDQFGYSSIHFIVQLPDTWLAVPTLADMLI